jgi:hypothetical protein
VAQGWETSGAPATRTSEHHISASVGAGEPLRNCCSRTRPRKAQYDVEFRLPNEERRARATPARAEAPNPVPPTDDPPANDHERLGSHARSGPGSDAARRRCARLPDRHRPSWERLLRESTENSIGAFNATFDAGGKWIETDVQFTSDAVPVLMHDSTVDRTTSRSGSIASMTAHRFTALTMNDGQHPPTLDQALDLCAVNPTGAWSWRPNRSVPRRSKSCSTSYVASKARCTSTHLPLILRAFNGSRQRTRCSTSVS